MMIKAPLEITIHVHYYIYPSYYDCLILIYHLSDKNCIRNCNKCGAIHKMIVKIVAFFKNIEVRFMIWEVENDIISILSNKSKKICFQLFAKNN